MPFLLGGAFAFTCYTGIERTTKDLDLFIRRSDYDRVGEVLRPAGYETDLTYPHWLGKVHKGPVFIDLIFNSGNGIAEVDDAWFEHAGDSEVLGVPVKVSPIEEMIWSRAFIMERERYDGADIAHLLRTGDRRLDWRRLLTRFGPHWRVLLSHLILFGFIYPAERDIVPVWLMDHLTECLREETHAAPPRDKLCGGTLLSREQYLDDVEQQGYRDPRLPPLGNMSPTEVTVWTEAIPDRTPTP
ncbi:hypothetical protein AAW51_0663 [Caldimonas brevitalea]|uniref:Nucleotidyltransferase family protein n=1 Tax=Caldimonas brevitalea TaxID=413882 RepID=A0A0G3BD98_9BURK|nr:hypothetical protein AAW51_0663 [Caldimonas brevitalea]